MAARPCQAQNPIWAFDSAAGLCVLYKPGFCQANGNKFYSKAECEEYCGVERDGECRTTSRTRTRRPSSQIFDWLVFFSDEQLLKTD